MELETTREQSLDNKLDPLVLKVAIILVFGTLAPLLDSTMVNVAIKTIADNFTSTVSVIQWVITGYVLAMAIATPVSGWATYRFGGKRVYMVSLIIFFIGSVLSSLSWNIGVLIGFRFLQGLGAGLMMPTMQTVLVQSSNGHNLGRVMSIVSIPALLGPILGPALGGIIVNSLGWRWIFYVNIPITIGALLLGWKGLPEEKPSTNKQSLDIIGILLVSLVFVLLIFGISMIKAGGGFASSAVLVPLMTGLLLVAVYIFYALNTKKLPVIDVHLFLSRNFTASSVLLFLTGILSNGAMFILPLYYQQVRGESVLFAGLLLIPQGIGMLLTVSKLGGLADRIGARLIMLVSLAATIAGTLPFAFAGPNTNQVLLAVALLVRGAGLGGLFVTTMSSAYLGLSKEQIPQASISTRIFQTIGGAFGSAILATIVQHQLSGYKSNLLILSNAYNVALWWTIGFALIAIIPILLLPMYKNEPQTQSMQPIERK